MKKDAKLKSENLIWRKYAKGKQDRLNQLRRKDQVYQEFERSFGCWNEMQ